jgi:hypothetical protein
MINVRLVVVSFAEMTSVPLRGKARSFDQLIYGIHLSVCS